MELLKVSKDTTVRELSNLISKGIIERKGSSRGTYYIIKECDANATKNMKSGRLQTSFLEENETNKTIVEWRLPEMEFEFTRVIIAFKNSPALKDLEKLGLNKRQIKAVKYVEKNKQIDRRTYCNINNVKQTLAYKELVDIVKKGVFEIRGKGRSTYYVKRTIRTISERFSSYAKR